MARVKTQISNILKLTNAHRQQPDAFCNIIIKTTDLQQF